MKHILWQLLNEAAEFLAGFLVLAGGFLPIVFGVPMLAAVLGMK